VQVGRRDAVARLPRADGQDAALKRRRAQCAGGREMTDTVGQAEDAGAAGGDDVERAPAERLRGGDCQHGRRRDSVFGQRRQEGELAAAALDNVLAVQGGVPVAGLAAERQQALHGAETRRMRGGVPVEPVSQNAALQGQRFAQQVVDRQPGAAGGERGELLFGERVQQGVILAQGFCRLAESRAQVGRPGGLEMRQHGVAHRVARNRGVAVRGILAPRHFARAQPGTQGLARDRKQRADHAAAAEMRVRAQAGEARGAGTAGQAQQQGFGHVVGVVAGGERVQRLLFAGAAEEVQARVARGHFQRAAVGGARGERRAAAHERQPGAGGEGFDKARVLVRLLAQSVVQVEDSQRDAARPALRDQQVEEGHGIRAAGDRHAQVCDRVQQAVASDHLRHRRVETAGIRDVTGETR